MPGFTTLPNSITSVPNIDYHPTPFRQPYPWWQILSTAANSIGEGIQDLSPQARLERQYRAALLKQQLGFIQGNAAGQGPLQQTDSRGAHVYKLGANNMIVPTSALEQDRELALQALIAHRQPGATRGTWGGMPGVPADDAAPPVSNDATPAKKTDTSSAAPAAAGMPELQPQIVPAGSPAADEGGNFVMPNNPATGTGATMPAVLDPNVDPSDIPTTLPEHYNMTDDEFYDQQYPQTQVA
jgi:hypothetical protein